MDLDGGKPIPITPEGITGGLISPDGQFIFRKINDEGGGVAVYPTAGGPPHTIPDLEPDFVPIQWSRDGSSVYGYLSGQVPAKVYKVNLAYRQENSYPGIATSHKCWCSEYSSGSCDPRRLAFRLQLLPGLLRALPDFGFAVTQQR